MRRARETRFTEDTPVRTTFAMLKWMFGTIIFSVAYGVWWFRGFDKDLETLQKAVIDGRAANEARLGEVRAEVRDIRSDVDELKENRCRCPEIFEKSGTRPGGG